MRRGWGRKWEVGRGKGRSVDPDREEAIAFWLRFGPDSVYTTKDPLHPSPIQRHRALIAKYIYGGCLTAPINVKTISCAQQVAQITT